MNDMREDIFSATAFGKAALYKLNHPDPGFRLYEAGVISDDTMEVKGCVFREAKSGPNKGKLCIAIKGTERIAYVNSEEMKRFE